jgi:spermidine/putrescine transport system substrate-binding protein
LTHLFCKILFLALLFLASCGQAKPRLYIYSWANYFKPDLLSRFEKEYGCMVILDTFESNEAMYAKLKVGASGYDIIVPTTYLVEIMEKQEMLSEIDPALIPNLKYLDLEYLEMFTKPHLTVSIPYMLSFAGIGYRKDRVPDIQPSWRVFDREDLRGRMTMLNDVREVIGVALKTLNFSVNTIKQAEIDQAVDLVLQWKKNLAKFESEQYTNGIASAEYLVVQGYSMDIMQVVKDNENVGLLFPEEGTIISCDQFVIPRHAENTSLAHAFINFFYNPEIAAENMQHVCALPLNREAIALVDPEFKKKFPQVFLTLEQLKRSEMIHDLGENITLYHRAWDQIKAARVN